MDVEVFLVDPGLERFAKLVEVAVHEARGADHAEAFRIERGFGQLSVLPGHLRRRGGELNVAGHHLDALARLDIFLRIEVDHFAAPRRDPAGLGQLRDGANAAAPRGDRFPHLVSTDANRRDDSQTSDDDFSH